MFNYTNFKKLQDKLKKQAFVPIDSKFAQAAPPEAEAGAPLPPPMGGMPPMDPSMTGGDPSGMGLPPPPSMGGMPPMDPSMTGGDPSGMGLPPPPEGGDVSPDGEPYMKFTPSQLTKFIRQILALSHSECDSGNDNNDGNDGVSGVDSATLAEVNAKLDAVLHAGA